ncbi:B12-binding domain-containing radical SAM protein [Bacteroidota bacterium]
MVKADLTDIVNSPSVIGVIPQFPEHTKQNIYGKVRMPPVGIISVLTQIKHKTDFSVYAIDENNYKGPLDINNLPDHESIQKSRPAAIAMFYGGMSNSIPRMFDVAKFYQFLGIPTIAGGSHVDALPEEALNSGIDIVVHGEGEYTALNLMNVMTKDGKVIENYKENLDDIIGISFLNNKNEHVFTGKRELPMNLDALEAPELEMIEFMNKDLSAIPINRGRGCDYSCEFCVVNTQYGRFKSVSAWKTFEQFKKYVEQVNKVHTDFFFTDDNFAQDIEGTKELCLAIGNYKNKRNKKFNIMVQVRSEIDENEKLKATMKYAGVKSLAIGFESPINEELNSMRKGVTVEKLVKRSRSLAKDFQIHGMFIFGYPTFKDSKHKSSLSLQEKAELYSKFFRKAKIDTIQVFNAVPLPGSELRRKLEAENRIPPLEEIGWDKYDGLFLCYVPEKGVNQFELQNLPFELMKKRYSGGFINRTLNYGNWMNWVFNFSIGLPLHFSTDYVKNFVNSVKEKKKAARLLPDKNVFYKAFVSSVNNFKKRTRNLGIKTYAAGMVKKWEKHYKNSDYLDVLKNLTKRKTTS